MKQLLIAGVIIGFILAIGYFFDIPRDTGSVTNFEECAKKYPVTQSYPGQCRTLDGTLFIEDIGESLF